MTSLAELTDRQAITDLISGLGLWLDEQRFDDAPSILAPDVTVDTPGGQAGGIERVVAQARRNHEGATTQHVITNALIALDGDRAKAFANLVVTFNRDGALETLGERYRFEAARTPEGWRLTRIGVTPLWRS